MPEPVLVAQGCVCFDRAPSQVAMTVDDIPILVRNTSAFVAHPPSIAIFEQPGVGEDDGIGLISAQSLNYGRKVINVACAASAIEPEFDEIAVVRCKLGKLGLVVTVISSGVFVFGFVAIPWR